MAPLLISTLRIHIFATINRLNGCEKIYSTSIYGH